MRIPRLGDRPAPHRGATRVFRRHEPEIRHELARMPEAREVAEFCDEGDGSDERHPAQRLQRGDDRRPAPRRRELTELRREPLDPLFGFGDRIAVFLERGVVN